MEPMAAKLQTPGSALSMAKVKVIVSQSCSTLADPMDCRPPGSSVQEILQAGIQEWVAIPFSRGSSGPRGRTQVSHITGRFFTARATRGATPNLSESSQNPTPLSWALIPVSSLDGGSRCTFQHLLQRSRSSPLSAASVLPARPRLPSLASPSPRPLPPYARNSSRHPCLKCH